MPPRHLAGHTLAQTDIHIHRHRRERDETKTKPFSINKADAEKTSAKWRARQCDQFFRPPTAKTQGLGLLFVFFFRRLQLQVPECSKQMHPDVGVSAARQRWSGPWELSGSAHWHHTELTSRDGNGIGATSRGAEEDGLLEAFRVFEVLQSRDIHSEKRPQ